MKTPGETHYPNKSPGSRDGKVPRSSLLRGRGESAADTLYGGRPQGEASAESAARGGSSPEQYEPSPSGHGCFACGLCFHQHHAAGDTVSVV